jgi:hypothetical protein
LRPLAEKWRTIPTLFFSVLSRKFWTILPSGKGHAARLSTPPLSLCVCVCVSRRLLTYTTLIFSRAIRFVLRGNDWNWERNSASSLRQRHHVFWLSVWLVSVCVCEWVCGADPDRKKEKKIHTSTVWWRVWKTVCVK